MGDLREVKVGDLVSVFGSTWSNTPSIRKVVKTTKLHLTDDHGGKWNMHGQRVPRESGHSISSARPTTQEDVDAVVRLRLQRKVEEAWGVKFKTCTNEQLKSILAIIDPENR